MIILNKIINSIPFYLSILFLFPLGTPSFEQTYINSTVILALKWNAYCRSNVFNNFTYNVGYNMLLEVNFCTLKIVFLLAIKSSHAFRLWQHYQVNTEQVLTNRPTLFDTVELPFPTIPHYLNNFTCSACLYYKTWFHIH